AGGAPDDRQLSAQRRQVSRRRKANAACAAGQDDALAAHTRPRLAIHSSNLYHRNACEARLPFVQTWGTPPMNAPAEFDTTWLARHLEQERRQANVLSEIREAMFGAQDGLTSVLAIISTVGGATGQPFAVLVAGFAAMAAGMFSMAAGEYMSSKSQ